MEKFDEIRSYFQDKLDRFGNTPRGADWNSDEAQNTRFDQLIKVIETQNDYSILDFGCGYGALADYLLTLGRDFNQFVGYDILESMVDKARLLHGQHAGKFLFTSDFSEVPVVDYAVASGVFNIKLDNSYDDWTADVIKTLEQLHDRTRHGFASNFLTKYSDADKMKPHLYYADPCYLFDYCKKHFSKNVALLHDYELYDFTILVRK